MIGPDDIAAFAAENADHIEAAKEMRRRAEKGLPVDRWGSEDAMFAAAKGIYAMEQLLAIYADASANMLAEIQRANKEAMGVYDRGGHETA